MVSGHKTVSIRPRIKEELKVLRYDPYGFYIFAMIIIDFLILFFSFQWNNMLYIKRLKKLKEPSIKKLFKILILFEYKIFVLYISL